MWSVPKRYFFLSLNVYSPLWYLTVFFYFSAEVFKTYGTLWAHQKRHSSKRSHECSLCGNRFHTKVELRRHSWNKHRIADDVEKYIESLTCTVCQKVLSTQVVLRKHMRSHTGINLLKCALCDFTTPYKNGLDKHMRSHSDQRDFPCDMCSKVLWWYCMDGMTTTHIYSYFSFPFAEGIQAERQSIGSSKNPFGTIYIQM